MASIAALRDEFLRRHDDGDCVVGTGSLLWDGARLLFALERRDYWTETATGHEIGFQGVGGGVESDESLVECLRREACEETTCDVAIKSSATTHRVADGAVERVDLRDEPAPILVYEASYGDGDGRWHLFNATYQASVVGEPEPASEVPGLVWLTPDVFQRSADGLAVDALPSGARLDGDRVPGDATLHPTFSASKLLEVVTAQGWPDRWTV